MAVGLDSSNSLLRSYLGKAYFEEKRDPLDARQFAIAKELDPLDPTPYLYDAIRLQSINRPVEAMLNMEKSIELNDNRAVYRSRQLLDSDRATRGANLAQIYNDLGFEQLGLNQGYESLNLASRQQRRPSLPLRRLYRGAAPRDRARERAAAGADAAGHQHQPGATESCRDQSQPADARRTLHSWVKRIHAAIRAQRHSVRRLPGLVESRNEETRLALRASPPPYTIGFR